MNYLKRMLVFFIIAILLLPTALNVAADTEIKVGDYLYLGVDESGEPILWRCVAMREDGPLMVSHNVITYKAFDANRVGVGTIPADQNDAQAVRDSYGSNNWKESSLRQWLNSTGTIVWQDTVPDAAYVTTNPYNKQNGFISGFTAAELQLVKPVTNKTVVCAIDTPDDGTDAHIYSLDWQLTSMLENYDTAYAQYTEDRFFCLNTPEIIQLSQNLPQYEIAYPTDYAESLCDAIYLDNVGATYYWLRDAYASRLFPEGVRCMYPGGHEYYYNAHNGNIGVRPAFVLADTTFAYGEGTADDPWRLDKTARTAPADTTVQKDAEVTKHPYVGTTGESQISGVSTTIAIGDYLTMGEMDGEPIVWRCVDIDENGPLLLSDKLLRFYSFDAAGETENDPTGERKQYGSNRWGTSSLRYWLNSNQASWGDWSGVSVPNSGNVYYGYSPYNNTPGFLTAFSQQELGMIKEVAIDSLLHMYDAEVADSGSESNIIRRKIQLLDNYNIAFKEQTVDKVFLLDRVQANKVYELFEDYILSEPTAGAVLQSGYKSFAISTGKTWHYWLRDAFGGNVNGEYPYFVYDITTDGRISSDIAYSAQYGVRPCFYLDMNALVVESGEGTKEVPFEVKRHTYGEDKILVAPQCERQGKMQRVCSICGEVETVTLEALEHTFNTKKTPENVFFFQKTDYSCTICGATYCIGGKAKPVLAVVFIAGVLVIAAVFFGIRKCLRKR